MNFSKEAWIVARRWPSVMVVMMITIKMVLLLTITQGERQGGYRASNSAKKSTPRNNSSAMTIQSPAHPRCSEDGRFWTFGYHRRNKFSSRNHLFFESMIEENEKLERHARKTQDALSQLQERYQRALQQQRLLQAVQGPMLQRQNSELEYYQQELLPKMEREIHALHQDLTSLLHMKQQLESQRIADKLYIQELQQQFEASQHAIQQEREQFEQGFDEFKNKLLEQACAEQNALQRAWQVNQTLALQQARAQAVWERQQAIQDTEQRMQREAQTIIQQQQAQAELLLQQADQERQQAIQDTEQRMQREAQITIQQQQAQAELLLQREKQKLRQLIQALAEREERFLLNTYMEMSTTGLRKNAGTAASGD